MNRGSGSRLTPDLVRYAKLVSWYAGGRQAHAAGQQQEGAC